MSCKTYPQHAHQKFAEVHWALVALLQKFLMVVQNVFHGINSFCPFHIIFVLHNFQIHQEVDSWVKEAWQVAGLIGFDCLSVCVLRSFIFLQTKFLLTEIIEMSWLLTEQFP